MNMNYFDAEKTRDDLVKWIRNWFERNGRECLAVIGISGGKDSTIVAGLCVRALGKNRVLGVLMPNGEQKDISDSIRVCKALDIENYTINIQDAYNGIVNQVFKHMNRSPSEQAYVNLAPRLRMTTLYAVSQTVNGRVVNTSNMSEAIIGYFTRNGDELGDLKPLRNLTKSEVVEIGKTMTEIPIDLIVKPPADGLTGLTDEDKIGFTYDELDNQIRTGEHGPNFEKIEEKIRSVSFKLNPPDAFFPAIRTKT